MRFKGMAVAGLLALAGGAGASDVKLEVRSSVQSERGGSSLWDDRTTGSKTALQVAPGIRWRWEGGKVAVDAGGAPSMDVPGRGAGFLTAFRGDGRLSYYPSRRVMLQARLDGGTLSFDERSLWAGRTRGSGEVRARFFLQPAVQLSVAYRHSRSAYQEEAGQAPPGGGRSDRRNGALAGLTWFRGPIWAYGEAGIETNGSTMASYGYRGRDVNFGAGGEFGRLSLGVHGSRSRRDYDLSSGGRTTWRTLWLSGEASWALSPVVSVVAGVQRETGSQDGSPGFEPWSFYHAGLSLSLPITQNRPTLVADGRRLGPVHTKEGWVFRFEADDAQSVHLVGTFSTWNPDTYKLRQISPNIWEVVVPLEPGIYEYAYVVDGGRWVPPPRAALYVDDGFGNRNGVLVVEEDDRR